MAVNHRQESRGIRICSVNIGGLSDRSKFVLDKYAEEEQYDVLTVQETGTVNMSKLAISNMTAITDSNKAQNKGAALYVRNNHSITELDIPTTYKNIDSCWGLTVIQNSRYIVGNIYVKLGDVTGITNMISMLEKAQLMSAKLKSKGVILTGDMNSRHQFWGDSTANEYGKKLLDKLDQSKFTIMTTETPSFLCTNGSSYIDLVIVSNNLVSKIDGLVTDTEVELFSGAPFRGHVPVITTINSIEHLRMPLIEQTSIKDMNWAEWSCNIENTIESKQEELSSIEDPRLLMEFVDKIINGATEKYGTKKIISCHTKPYWTKKLSDLSKKLRNARKNYNKRNTDRNKAQLTQCKIEFDEERQRACQEFIMKKTKNLNAVESHKFWKEFKKITIQKTNQKVSPLDDGDGGLVTECKEIEDLLFSTFFEGKHMEEESFDDKFYEETNNFYENIMNEETSADDDDDVDENTKDLNADITTDEIVSAVKNSKTSGKSFDNHKYHPEMLKNLGPMSIQLILIIFNLCLQLKVWIWENAEVIFLKKEGKKSYSLPGSYRPISITSYLGKLLEKILSVRAKKFLKKKNYHDPDQEGFTEMKNTIRYLNRLILGIKADLEKGKTVICLFLDFEKAFDSVWKKGLIVKLFKLGFKGRFLKLIDNFLSSRKVRLKVNGRTGESRESAEFGLPQGSVLSPILFKIFMMDFLEELNVDSTVVFKFADDGSVKITADTTEECLIQLQKILDAVNSWARKWRMVINCLPNKTEVICFGTAENNKNLVPKEFKLGDKKIKLVRSTKVLGIIIDEDLSFIEQSTDVYKKLTTRWNMIQLYCNRNWGFSQRVMVELIRTLFLSCLFYGSHLWMNKQNMKEINSLYYTMLKSAVGAVFHVRQSILEVILVIAPIHIQNKVNQIKHYLKININQVPDDPLKDTIREAASTSTNNRTGLHSVIRSVYKFLEWKMVINPNQFREEDKEIINQRDISKYHLLSASSCKYTKNMISKFTEKMWSDSLKNEFLSEGHSVIPKPSCAPLNLNPNADRRTEVVLMSMFYENNLMNSFLHRHNIPGISSALCPCGSEEQTAAHILLRCQQTDPDLRARARDSLMREGEPHREINHTAILNLSRDNSFMNVLFEIIYHQRDFFRDSIELK